MIVMSIAGVDPSAGAGVFADLKTFQAIGVYGTGIVTALTAQNPYKFFSTQPVSPEYIEEQIELRRVAKSNKNYELADQIRQNLLEKNIIIKDTREGTTFEVIK